MSIVGLLISTPIITEDVLRTISTINTPFLEVDKVSLIADETAKSSGFTTYSVKFNYSIYDDQDKADIPILYRYSGLTDSLSYDHDIGIPYSGDIIQDAYNIIMDYFDNNSISYTTVESEGSGVITDQLILNLNTSDINSYKYRYRIYDYGIWTDGSVGNIGQFTSGSGDHNIRIVDTDPWGNDSILWKGYSSETYDATYPSESGIYCQALSIDNSKLYRMSYWENRKTNGNATYANYYFGLTGNGTPNGVKYIDNGNTTTNPYFFYGNLNILPIDQWVLVVGHVWPHNHTGTTNHVDSGVFNTSGTKIDNIFDDFKWFSGTTTGRPRTLSIYRANDTGVTHYSHQPRSDIINGTEPSLQDLIDNKVDYLIDTSNNNNDGQIFNGAKYNSSSGGVLLFDGENDYIQTSFGNGTNFTTTTITVCAWVRSIASNKDQMWIDWGSDGTNQRFYSGLNTLGHNSMGIQSSSGETLKPSDLGWHFQTIVMDSSNAKAYDNGIYLFSKSYTSYSIGGDIRIGGRSHEEFSWDGFIGQILIYNKELSETEIITNYTTTRGQYGV